MANESSQLAYRIVDWWRYEVTSKGSAARSDTPFADLRQGPLAYVRHSVHGHSVGPGYRRMVNLAWSKGCGMDLAVMGLFVKLTELAASQDRQWRGWILDDRQRPMDIEQIADLLMVRDRDAVRAAMEVLCDARIGWVLMAKLAPNDAVSQDFPENPGTVQTRGQDFPENPGPVSTRSQDASRETETEQNRTKQKGARSREVSVSVSDGKTPTPSPAANTTGHRRILEMQISQVLAIGAEDKGDRTVLRHIMDQAQASGGIETMEWARDRAAQVVRDAPQYSRRQRLAIWVKACKARFYRPERRRILTQTAGLKS